MKRPSAAGIAAGFLVLTVAAGCESPRQSPPTNPMDAYGITASNAFFYYDDLEAANEFYTGVLGLKTIVDYGFAKILQIGPTSLLTLVDQAHGMHSSQEPKTVAIALITDQLDEWFDYLSGQDLEMKFGYDPQEGRPHHGFVAVDPEGYLLEFERFNQHPENERFMPILDATATVPATPTASNAPSGLGFKATVIWLYYRDMERAERFYEDAFGLELLVDQGWAKVYRTSDSGYLGLVDEKRGMHNFTETKAVTVSFLTDDLEGWFSYAKGGAFELRSDTLSGEGDRVDAFVGYDPGGYFLEFDHFLEHADNTELLALLQAR
ncbi:MAG: catechol 2,3-dioxygenase-like lactoylglutathione lyase family enzyme [Rhodothermales bacterium]|jgi:catechol 2,3-dioxygenase-like lactoylglutathione lyase family enzyme